MLTRLLIKSTVAHDERIFAKAVKHVDNRVVYYGNSLGGIMGSVLMAMSPDLKIGSLGVPGSSFALLIPRNLQGGSLLSFGLPVHFSDAHERIAIRFFLSQYWDLCGPSGYTDMLAAGGTITRPGVFDSELPNGLGKRKLLIQQGIGDCQVSSIAGLQFTRSVNASVFVNDAYEKRLRIAAGRYYFERTGERDISPTVDSITQLQVIQPQDTQPRHTVATVFGFALSPTTQFYNVPSHGLVSDTHEMVRGNKEAIQQNINFIGTYLDGKLTDNVTWVEQACKVNEGCWNLKNWRWFPPLIIQSTEDRK